MLGTARRLWPKSYLGAYLLLVGWFLARLSAYYNPTTGLTSMILFGDLFASHRLPQLRGLPLLTLKSSNGYDGQFYAQLAVTGTPFDPALKIALDSPSYRSRRILTPLLAHVMGLGNPWWVLNAYALTGILCWLLYAWVLARWWFPPDDLLNLLRWAGCLFGAGMVVSVTRSLTDGPAVLFVALGVRALEVQRRWLGAAVFAAAGFVRETTIVCAAVFFPPPAWDRRSWARSGLAAAICVVPVVLWIVALAAYHGYAGVTGGTPAVTWPLAGALRKMHLIYTGFRAHGFTELVRIDVFTFVSLVVQVVFLLTRPRLEMPVWRIGATFAALCLFLSWPMWDDTPVPIARYLLPVTLAFNRLVPSGRAGILLLALGNLSILLAPNLIQPPIPEDRSLPGGLSYDYGPGWFDVEGSRGRTWRWANGATKISLHNPSQQTFAVTLRFDLASRNDRTMTIVAGERRIELRLKAHKRGSGTLGPFTARPGDTTIDLLTSEPAWVEPGASGRPLAFLIENIRADVAAEPAPPPSNDPPH